MTRLDPETFTYSELDGHWQVWESEQLGQFEIAVMPTESFAPAPWALEQLERELARIEALFDAALVAAKSGWGETYGRCAPETGWSLERIAIEEDGGVTVEVYEGEIDTYGAWDVAMRDGAALGVKRRQI